MDRKKPFPEFTFPLAGKALLEPDRWSLKCRSRLSWHTDSCGFVWLWINHREQLPGAGGALCGSGDVDSPSLFHTDLTIRVENEGGRFHSSAETK